MLTVGRRWRGSRMRRLAGFEPVKTSPPMDVLWFKLPREEGDPEGAMGRVGRGHIAILLDRYEYWQAGYVITSTFPELRQEGIGALRRSFAELVPSLRIASSIWRTGSITALLSRAVVRGGTSRAAPHRGRRPRDESGRRGWDQLRHPGRRRRGERACRTTEGESGAAQRAGHKVSGCGAAQARAANPFHPDGSDPDPASGAGERARSEQLAPPRWLRLLSRVPLVRSVPAHIFGLTAQCA